MEDSSALCFLLLMLLIADITYFSIVVMVLSRCIEIKLQITRFFVIKSFFKKQRGLELAFPASFSALLLKENIYLTKFCYLTKLNYVVASTSWDIGQYVRCNCLLTKMWHRINFKINPIFLIKPFLLHEQNVKTKI